MHNLSNVCFCPSLNVMQLINNVSPEMQICGHDRYLRAFWLQMMDIIQADCAGINGGKNLTVDFGASQPQPAPLGLSTLKQAVVNISHELVELRVRRVHDLHSGFTQDPTGGPAFRGQGHDQEDHRTDAQQRGHRERYPFPQARHLRSPWCPGGGNTTPGWNRGVHTDAALCAITMSLS